MKFKSILIVAILAIFATSCEKEANDDFIRIRINHYQIPANPAGASPSYFTWSYMIQKDNNIGTESWERLPAEIAGFDYEPGFIYDVILIKPKNDATIVGGFPTYTLRKVITKTAIANGTTYELNLSSGNSVNYYSPLTKDNQTGSYYLIGKKIEYDKLIYDALDSYLAAKKNITGVFRHSYDANSLHLLEVKAN